MKLPGLQLENAFVSADHRGSFIKSVVCGESGFLGHSVAEVFTTVSRANVLRGMHYQEGPYKHSKTVTCLAGSVLDVVVCINPYSSLFGKTWSTILYGTEPKTLFMSDDYAHGFLTLENNSVVSYTTSTPYSSSHDVGVLWNSIDFEWPCSDPVLSARDTTHPPLSSLLTK